MTWRFRKLLSRSPKATTPTYHRPSITEQNTHEIKQFWAKNRKLTIKKFAKETIISFDDRLIPRQLKTIINRMITDDGNCVYEYDMQSSQNGGYQICQHRRYHVGRGKTHDFDKGVSFQKMLISSFNILSLTPIKKH